MESAQGGALQAVGVASTACGGKRSRRMVALGRRIGGGGASAETAAVSTAAHGGHAAEPKCRSGGSGRSRSENSGVSLEISASNDSGEVSSFIRLSSRTRSAHRFRSSMPRNRAGCRRRWEPPLLPSATRQSPNPLPVALRSVVAKP